MSLSLNNSTTQMPDGLAEDEDLKVVDSGVLRRTFALNAKEWVYILAGIVGAELTGVAWPVASIAMVQLTQLMILPNANTLTAVRPWILAFLGVGVGAFIGNILHLGALGVSGERLTRKLRTMSFRALLRAEIGYFDKSENSVGALTTRLSREAALVKGVTGDTLGAVTSVVASLASGLTIAFASCWRVTLVVLAIIPGVVIGGYLEMQMSAGLDAGSAKRMSESGRIASEAVDNIATFRSIGCEKFFNDKLQDSLSTLRGGQTRKANVTGVTFGFSEFCQYLIWYAAFKAGVVFVRQGHCDFFELLQSIMAILFGAMTLGNVAMFFPDIGESRVAATSIYRLLDRVSTIDPEVSGKGNPVEGKEMHGDVLAAKMRFEYPTRPDVPVLRGLSVAVRQGQQLALVGASGCGKSTIVSLLERFYDIRTGELIVDGEGVETIPVNELRSGLGIVTQDPYLFNRSVRDNIT